MAPTVSVILPTFNRLQYLRQAVESVFAQTFQDWELVIADDGSDEETRSFLRTLVAEPRVRVLWLRHSGNPAAVRNAAIAAAHGEYVAFLDSDDLWMAAKLERQVEGLRARATRRWSYTGYALIDAGGRPRPYPTSRPRIPCQGAILGPLLAHEPDMFTPAVLVERRLLREVGGFDEQLVFFEDYDLWLRLACRSDVDLIDEPLISVRSHDQHYCTGGVEMLISRHRSLGKLNQHMPDRRLLARVDRLYARSTLDLANVTANTDRIAAVRLLSSGCPRAWKYLEWWARLPRVALKIATPRVLLELYRRARARRGADTSYATSR
jgi:glycosyltransferase involved in cell wall biosynthesis